MISMGTAAYDSILNYPGENKQILRKNDTAPVVGSKKSTAQIALDSKRDRVTLSDGVVVAKLREELGLNPTGSLVKQDIEVAATADKDKIFELLDIKVPHIGIESNKKIPLSLSENGKIIVGGRFRGKAELQKVLNNEDEFVNSFERFSMNKGILDYTDNLDTHIIGMNLFAVINDDPTPVPLTKTATHYKQSRSATDPLVKLIQLGRQNNPHEFIYKS